MTHIALTVGEEIDQNRCTLLNEQLDHLDDMIAKLGQWLQPELMTDYYIDRMTDEDARDTLKRYRNYLLELDNLARFAIGAQQSERRNG